MRVSRTRYKIPSLLLSCALVFLAGCGTTTVILLPGDPVRIRADVKAKVWMADEDGEWLPTVMVLPAGWYCLQDARTAP